MTTTETFQNQENTVRIRDYHVIDDIRSGTFSHIVRAHKVDSGTFYAIKAVPFDTNRAKHNYQHERSILASLTSVNDDLIKDQNSFITPLVESFVESGSLGFLVFPLAICDLMDLLFDIGRWMYEAEAIFYLSELLVALDYIHSRGIVHLDVKLENVLVTQDGHCQLTDFDRAFNLSNDNIPSAIDFQGTLHAMAPEVACCESILPQSDLWSMGILAITLVTGPPSAITPDLSFSVQRSLARSGQHLSWPANSSTTRKLLSTGYLCMLRACLQLVPTDRPSNCLSLIQGDISGPFGDMDWNLVRTKRIRPPFLPASLSYPGDSAEKSRFSFVDVQF